MGDGAAGANPRSIRDALAAELPDTAFGLDAAELKRRGLQRPLSYLVHRHVGVPAVVIGGGMSLPAAMQRAPSPDEAIYISANHHGVKYWPCRYIVHLDDNEPLLDRYDVPRISPRKTATIRIMEQRVNQSGMMGAYVAWALGCTPILLAGMDCFQGGTYHDDPKAKSSGTTVRLEDHLSRWRMLRDILAGADVRALGGTVLEHGIFPAHDPLRPAGPPADPAAIFAEVGGVVVQFGQSFRLRPSFELQAGDIIEMPAAEQRDLGRHRFTSITCLGSVKHEPALRFRCVPLRHSTPRR